MLSPKTSRDISRIIPFGLIWLVFSFVYTQLEKGIIGGLKYYPATGNPYDSLGNLIIVPIAAFITGLLTGILEVLYFNKLFQQKTFGKKILFKPVIYLLIILLFLVVLTTVANVIQLKTSVFDKRVWNYAWVFFTNYSFLSVVLYIGSIIFVTQFYNEVSENLGQSVLRNFLTGKYHSPTEEERIFMFLDMKASTAIAENLGHVKYFQVLREYYADLSDPVINFAGEIYQYVGDELVVSWTLENGLQNNNCIQCFFAMRNALLQQADKYNAKFGVLPSFKAGFHLGKVTTGEIGVLKKEIIFTGDVLNTSARIQSLCNSYKTDILISGKLIARLNMHDQFEIKSLGEKELRGRDEKIELFTIVA